MKTDHIPFQLPKRSFALNQEWRHLSFLHWMVDEKYILPYIPKGLELDTFNNNAYISTIPFLMKDVRPRFLPSLNFISTFPEFNIRTYVKFKDKSGVSFLTLDAQSKITCLFAPYAYGLPYRYALGSLQTDNNTYLWNSKRISDLAELKGYCKPVGKYMTASDGSLEEFLFERYCLFTLINDNLCIGYVAHKPWVYQKGQVELESNSFTESYNLGIKNLLKPDLVHISDGLRVKTWSIEKIN